MKIIYDFKKVDKFDYIFNVEYEESKRELFINGRFLEKFLKECKNSSKVVKKLKDKDCERRGIDFWEKIWLFNY